MIIVHSSSTNFTLLAKLDGLPLFRRERVKESRAWFPRRSYLLDNGSQSSQSQAMFVFSSYHSTSQLHDESSGILQLASVTSPLIGREGNDQVQPAK
ncbi:hypothetical protein HUJ04_006792 [Dendroctonus ponderosae]|nr:hypothetical protein HUJ04_006792 [Dendroctonus ponderosae]